MRDNKKDIRDLKTNNKSTDDLLTTDLENEIAIDSIVTGTVISASKKEIIVDLGNNVTGVILRGYFSYRFYKNPENMVKVGEKVTGIITDLKNENGNIELSISKYELIHIRERLQKAYENKEILKGKIESVNSLGYIVDIDFFNVLMPKHHFVDQEMNSDSLIGKEVKGIIIDYDPKRLRAVFSQKAYNEYLKLKQENSELLESDRSDFLEDRPRRTSKKPGSKIHIKVNRDGLKSPTKLAIGRRGRRKANKNITLYESSSEKIPSLDDLFSFDDLDLFDGLEENDRSNQRASFKSESFSELSSKSKDNSESDNTNQTINKLDELFLALDNDQKSEKRIQENNEGIKSLETSEVEFSVVVPKKVEKDDYLLINVIMYEDDYRYIVEGIREDTDEPTQEIRGGIHVVSKRTNVRIELTSPTLDIEDNIETKTWLGKYQTFSFDVYIPENLRKKTLLFNVSVYFNEVLATTLKFKVKVSESNDLIDLFRKDIHSAFVSYASQDRSQISNIVYGIKKARPDLDVFFDVESLRSGQDWEIKLNEAIDKRDLLYLCWSNNAKNSNWVDYEWRRAYKNKGVEFVEPIPLEPPEECPPPKELDKKHFNDSILYIVKYYSNKNI